MDPEILLTEGSKTLFTNGILGLAVAALVYFVMLLRAELRDLRLAHKVEIAEKDKLIQQIQAERLDEALVGRDLAKSMQSTLEALIVAGRRT